MVKILYGSWGKTAWKSRNRCCLNGEDVGAYGPLTQGSNVLSPKSKYKRSKYVLSITCIAFITVNFFTKLPSKLKISRSGNHEAVCKCTCILNWMVLRKHGQRSRSGRLKLHPRPIHDPSRFEEVISLHCHFSHGSDSQTFLRKNMSENPKHTNRGRYRKKKRRVFRF